MYFDKLAEMAPCAALHRRLCCVVAITVACAALGPPRASRVVRLRVVRAASSDAASSAATSTDGPPRRRGAYGTASAAARVAGTTVGGGFLGLPAVAAPAGFGPTAVTLSASWLFLLAEALVVAEAVGRCRGPKAAAPSVAVVAAEAGVPAQAIRGLFFALVTATLASQLSKAGSMLAGPSYRAATLAAAAATLAFALGPSVERAAGANALLTAVFAAAAVAVGGGAAAAARGGALPFDASLLLRSGDASAARRALPTVLQLLVFAETVPTVSGLLDGDPRRVRLALAFGSLCPLVLECAWAYLGLGLGAPRVDPVDVLLAAPATRAATAALAASAVATTALGSALALRSDVPEAVARRKLAALLAALPAVGVALTSPDVFFAAMDWAGAYPVALLWGLFPPVALLRLRRKTQSGYPKSAGPDAWLAALAAVSGLFVASTATRDLGALVRRFVS